jgi:hypothetical protein
MLLLLIVLPCTLVGTSVVVLLDRAGVLPRLDRPGPASAKPVGSIFRPVSLTTIVVLATWCLAWLVVLAVGLNIILASS